MSTILLWHDDAGAAVAAVFDVDESETHDLQNIVTEHPVESGSDISDNVRPELDRFTIQGFVTDSPTYSNPINVLGVGTYTQVELQVPDYPFLLGESALLRAGVNAIGSALFGKPKHKATLLKFDNFKSRKRVMYEILDDARRNARVCRVITALHEYEDMVIEQITITRAPDDGNGATFSVSLKEISFVSSEQVDAPEPAEISGQIKKATGSKNGKESDAKKKAANDTALSQLYDATKG